MAKTEPSRLRETAQGRRLGQQKTSRKRGHLRRIILALLGILLGIGLFMGSAQSLGGEPLPMPFGTGLAVVLSGSMEPALHTNDLIIVRKAEDYAVGDIVVWQSGNSLIVHRIVEMDDQTLTTRGDANNVDDEPIPPSALRGKVAHRLPRLGAVVRIIKQPSVWIMLLVLAILLMELSFRREKDIGNEQLEALRSEILRLREQKGKENDNEEER